MSTRVIAQRLGISEPTAAARIRALASSGTLRVVLKRGALQDYPAGALFRIEIFVDDPGALDSVTAALLEASGILSAYQTAGRPEIIATCLVPHVREAGIFFDQLSARLTGAARFQTAMILKARHQRPCLHNLTMPERVALADADPLRASLRRDARRPASLIARELGIPEATARQRTRRLIDAPGNRVVAMQDAKAIGFGVWADIQLTICPKEASATMARLGSVPDIVLATQNTGESNIGLFIAAAEVNALDRFVTSDVRTLPGLINFRVLRVTDVITTDYSVDFVL